MTTQSLLVIVAVSGVSFIAGFVFCVWLAHYARKRVVAVLQRIADRAKSRREVSIQVTPAAEGASEEREARIRAAVLRATDGGRTH